MLLEIKLIKSDNNIPWGFRLAGGADLEQPLTVVKVIEGSLADLAGLADNDVVVKINNIPTTGLTHLQVQHCILSAGIEFALLVSRDDDKLPIPLINDKNNEQNNAEVVSILQAAIGEPNKPENRSSTLETPDKNTNFNPQDNIYCPHTSKACTEEVEISTADNFGSDSNLTSSKSQEITQTYFELEHKLKERKWSTFLQKPKGPKPERKTIEAHQPKVEPYRVIIKKQKKKKKQRNEIWSETNPQTVKNTKIEKSNEDDLLTYNQQIKDCTAEDHTEETEECTTQVQEANLDAQIRTNEEKKEEEMEIINEEEKEEVKMINKEEKEEVEIINEEEKEEEMNIISATEKEVNNEKNESTCRSLDGQLAEIQKQLQELAKLPSTIQSTLNAVTQQLANIVNTSQHEKDNSEAEINEQDEMSEDLKRIEYNDNVEETLNSYSNLEMDSLNEYEFSANNNYVEEISENKYTESLEDGTTQDMFNLSREKDEVNKIELKTLENIEKESILLEEYNQRRLEQESNFPLTPLERPIILPGGRKWSQPDDACPTFRHPQMTDEKIANTIETYSEVIAGQLKGINFLKYQPPPKNLDYLQRSEVYRLVHDMEPFMKGIARRASKIVAEQDYYTQI